MGKIYRLEELIQPLAQIAGVKGCAVVASSGQSDVLYDANIGEIDRAVLGAMVSSLALIGERLAQEFGGAAVNHHTLGFGDSTAVIVPGANGLVLLVLAAGDCDRDGIISAGMGAIEAIGELLRNKAAEA